MTKRPNIIIFNPDQMRADALAHLTENPAAQTPFLDSFAQNEAVSYRNAFCQNPVCVPSRCSFFTGLYPHVHGHRTMNYMLHEHETTLLEELKNSGYYVWSNTRNDLLPAQIPGIFDRHHSETFYGGDVLPAPGVENPDVKGKQGEASYYSHFAGRLKTDKNGVNYSNDDEIVDAAIECIKNRVNDQPLCMFIGLINPHPPYKVEEPYYSTIDREKLPPRISAPSLGEIVPKIEEMIREKQNMASYTEKQWDELRACYYGMCLKVDEMFKRLCDGLKEAGIYDNSAIFFFSDHGDYLGDYGISEKSQNTMEDCLVRVPFLIKPPKGMKVDTGVSDSLVELIDFYATAMNMAQVKPTHSHFGIDLTKNLENRTLPVREFVCCEGGRLEGELHCDESHASGPAGIQPQNSYWPRVSSQEDDIAHTKATMIRTDKYKLVQRLYEPDQFFDLEKDPKETHNAINDINYKEVILDLKMKLLSWYQATCDIVPFEYDSRFNYEMTWNRCKLLCPPDCVDEVQAIIREGKMQMFDIIRLCERLKRERENVK